MTSRTLRSADRRSSGWWGSAVLILTERTTQMSTSNKTRRMAGPPAEANAEPAVTPTKRLTKQSQVIDLLRGTGGVALAKIVVATGWQAHTARAALTGLRKQGHAIARSKIDGETRYSIAAAPPE
jgi:hypothetical protein